MCETKFHLKNDDANQRLIISSASAVPGVPGSVSCPLIRPRQEGGIILRVADKEWDSVPHSQGRRARTVSIAATNFSITLLADIRQQADVATNT